MKCNITSIQISFAALVAIFALVAMPTASFATTDLSTGTLELPSVSLPALTTETLKLEPVTCKVSLSDKEIVSGESVTVSWETTGLDEIKLNGEVVSGDKGSKTFENVTENTTFKLTGSNHKGGSCDASVKLTCVPPVVKEECELTLHKSVNKITAVPGDQLTYTITIENTGKSDCTGGGVRIFDEIDDNLEFVSQSITDNLSPGYGGSQVYSAGDHTLRFNGHVLNPGETGEITWVGKVKTPDQCGNFEVKNKAKATAKELNNFKNWSYSNQVVTDVTYTCDKPTPPQCPIDAAPGRIIIDFSDKRLRSDKGESQGQTTLQTINVPAGQYDIRLVSYDGYIGRENVSQSFEQYQLQFVDGSTEISRSNPISDLADLVREATNDEVVNNNFNLSADADGLRAVHAFLGDTSSPNSLNPICASLDPIEPEPELPSCDFFTASPTEIQIGQSATLNWGTTNATQVFINNGIGNVDVDGSLEVSPLVTTTYVLTVIGEKDKTVDCHVKVKVDDTPKRPECPFTPGPDVTVFDFNERLRSDQSLGNSQTDIQSTSIAAGQYNISLASWDGYANRVNVSQPHEQWQLEFLFGTNQVGISNAISDLEDNVQFAFLQEQVNSQYELAAEADGVRAVHAFYPDNFSANSVEPICAAIEKHEDPVPTCDAFTADPTNIVIGNTAELAWETTNATRVVINNGIGEVDADGSVSVSPLVDTVYELTVFGTNDQSASCEVPVTVSEDPVPVCVAFSATPENLPLGGGDVTLEWEVEDATSVTITPTIGSVALTGSTVTGVTESTTFTLNAVDANGDEVSCIAPVTVPDPQPFTCENNVDFGASPNSVRRGTDVTLSWNVTNADSVSISGINATAFSGSEIVEPNDDTTYVLTATFGNETIECPATVTVSTGGGGGGSSSPRCELDISDEQIKLGEEITITWDTSRATEVSLVDDLGNVIFDTDEMLAADKDELFDGSVTLAPTRDTEYTLVAERGSRDRTCRVAVEVEDDIVIIETRDQQPLVAGISLSSVPHTGFEAGPFMTTMFYVLLIAWAFYIAYLVVLRKQMANTSANTNTLANMRSAEEKRPDVFVQSVQAPVMPETDLAPSNLPVSDPVVGYEANQVTDVTVTEIEDRAHEQKALLSSDAIRHFVSSTAGSVERDEALDEVISEAKKAYPLEDGWIVINESRMQNLCEVCKVNVEKAPVSFTPTVVPEGSSSLAEAIVTGNVVAAYEMIGNRPMFSLADAAADLDAVYRNRHGEDKVVSGLLANESANLSDEQIKNMITALTSALDGTYTDEASAVKMAIMKAVKETS